MPAWRKGATGLPANRPRNGGDRICEECGESFYVPLGRIKEGARFCSHPCYVSNRWGPSHKEERSCASCGGTFVASRAETQRTCSVVCSGALHSLAMSGSGSHFWRGGITPGHTGSEWRRQRKATLERDSYRCVECGSPERPHVHHKTPYRYSHSHALDNLVTLCPSHHAQEEIRVNEAMRSALIFGRHPGGQAKRLNCLSLSAHIDK